MVKVKWLGHSAFFIDSGDFKLIIDPFLTGNPTAAVSPHEIECDYILITHGHGDHVGDAFDIAKRCDARIIAPNELAIYAMQQGCKVEKMHIGGTVKFPFGEAYLTQAFHGSSIVEDDGKIIYTGMPCGFVITINGRSIYHAGDTGLFGDMALIPRRHTLDLALLPIGDRFTMGPEEAAYAVELLLPKIVVPMHYGTWPQLTGDVKEFSRRIDTPGTKVVVMKPGEDIEI